MEIKENIIYQIFTWIFRILSGLLFIYSGFVKAIDPWGTILKLGDYSAVLDLPSGKGILVIFVFILCIFEFVVGVSLLTGCYRRSTPIVGLIFMLFMLPLTLWIALTNPVADCGCFGDAWVISNNATFFKNVIMTLILIWLIKFNKETVCLITPAFQWIVSVISASFILIIEFCGYNIQPLLDFRPYPVGYEAFQESNQEDEPEFRFVYEKDGKEKEFDLNNIPSEEEGWKFKERRQITPLSNENPKSGITLIDRQGEDVEPEEVLDGYDQLLIVTMPDFDNVSLATSWKLNALSDWCMKNHVGMIALAGGNAESIEEWEDLSLAEYPIFMADDTQLQQIVRGNPGVVYLENNKILWKKSLSAIDVDRIIEGNNKILEDYTDDFGKLLFNLSSIYVIVIAFFIFISFTPNLFGKIYKKQLNKQTLIDDDKVHHE